MAIKFQLSKCYLHFHRLPTHEVLLLSLCDSTSCKNCGGLLEIGHFQDLSSPVRSSLTTLQHHIRV
jgi:hypothetical protein